MIVNARVAPMANPPYKAYLACDEEGFAKCGTSAERADLNNLEVQNCLAEVKLARDQQKAYGNSFIRDCIRNP